MWSSPFLKGLFIALLSLPFLLSAFLPIPPPDIPYLTHIGAPLPKHPSEITGRFFSDFFWISGTEVLFHDQKRPGMHPKIWNWRTGKITALPGYNPSFKSTRSIKTFRPSPDGCYLLFIESEEDRKKPYQEWLYLLHLRSTNRKPGIVQPISAKRVIQPYWFPDSTGFVFRRNYDSPNAPAIPAKISIQSVSGATRVREIEVPHLNERGYTSSILGITSGGDMIHISYPLNRTGGGYELFRTPLRDSNRSVTRYRVVRPRSLATTSFSMTNVSINGKGGGRDRLLWVERRTTNPLHHLGHQVNQMVSNLRFRYFWYFDVETYTVLWVSDVDGSNFRQIGRTPPNTYLLDEQWIPNSNQVAIRLLERNPDNTTRSDRFYFCPVE